MAAENLIGGNFDSLAKRILYSYYVTYPVYKPVSIETREVSQREMYEFMKDTLLYIYKNPQIIDVEESMDDAYEDWQMNNAKPELIKAMEKIESKFAGFMEMLIKIGKYGELKAAGLFIPSTIWKVPKAFAQKLPLLGIDYSIEKEGLLLRLEKYPNAFPVWKLSSEYEEESLPQITKVLSFIHGRNLGRKFKATQFFGHLMEDVSTLEKLEQYLEKNGFTYVNSEASSKTRYTFTKWVKNYPKSEFAYMNIYYNWRLRNQMKYEFRLPKFSKVLIFYSDMNTELQEFVFNRLKNCDNCGYCTQTDKTGKRKKLAMNLKCHGMLSNKCPLYPNLKWNSMNETELTRIQELFSFAESC